MMHDFVSARSGTLITVGLADHSTQTLMADLALDSASEEVRLALSASHLNLFYQGDRNA